MSESGERRTPASVLRGVGTFSAVATAVLAAVAFGTAVTTPPRTGPFATRGSAIAYPYSAAAQFVPRDFLWMYPALAMMLAFVVLAACVRESGTGRRLFGTLGLGLAVASMAVIAIDYFIQLRVVQPSLLNGESEGLAIVSQYNPHGVFIALEELGFLLAGLAFCFLAFALGRTGLERAARWVLLTSFALVAGSFIGLSVAFGFGVEYRFEVAAITIIWLTLALVGVMLAFVFARSAPRR
jgi:hypothetical protein